MKPKPLKDKEHDGLGQCTFESKDIKSAVEWLRDELCVKHGGALVNMNYVLELINKAFEDVTKKP